MTTLKFHITSVGILLLLASGAGAQEKGGEYSIVAAKSRLEVRVEKEGFLKAFGHNHLIVAKQISGAVKLDANKVEVSSVHLNVETKSLTVSPEGEPEKDRADIQATMSGEKVLNVDKYPEIAFMSTGVSDVKAVSDGWTLTLSGKLKLHGVEKAVSFPIVLRVKGNELQTHGEVSLLQSEYGITPIKVGGGAVTVKDRLKISFDIVAGK